MIEVSDMGLPYDFVPSDGAELAMCLSDPEWRIFSGHLYKIIVKSNEGEEGKVLPFKPNRAQRRFLKRLWHRNIILKARQLGFCLDPNTRVLTASLKWKRIADLVEGEQVVATDEHPSGGRGSARRMRTATVQACVKVHRKAYRITFDDGRTVICTAQHPWLSKKAGTSADWRSLDGTGNQVVGRLKVGTSVRWVTKPWGAASAEDGWFGGMLDGEGSMSKASGSAGVCVSQRPGPVWDRMVRYARAQGYSFCQEGDIEQRPSKHGGTAVPKLSFGRMDEMFRLIGQTRPTRFLGRRFWEGRELPGKRNGGVGWATITAIEELGEQTMVDLQTSTGTYIAEGFVSHNTTLIAVLWLDHALFNANQRCAIVAQDLPTAQSIFRDKVKFAYDNLPPALREAMPLATDSQTELLFSHNNSSVKVATSVRGGTIDRLHVSEFGKICAKFPQKATEVVTGSLPAVPLDGVAIIESTAEGQGGEFHAMCEISEALSQQTDPTTGKTKPLTPRDWRFHFYPWHAEQGYRMDPAGVVITPKDHEYFDQIEAELKTTISLAQRAWYCATRNTDFAGSPEKMWQEYPSTPKEAFQQSTEGTYYATQLAQARKDGRIGRVPHVSNVPVNTFWDIGARDGTAIWFHQKIGAEHRFIKFMEGWGEPYQYFVSQMQAMGWIWGRHYLPHDAAHERQLGDRVMAPIEMLRELAPGWNFEIVPRVDEVIHGIQAVRSAFSQYYFDETNCAEGLVHLQQYRKEWDNRLAVWKQTPRHDEHSEAADALRQHAQGWRDYAVSAGTRPNRRNRSGMAA